MLMEDILAGRHRPHRSAHRRAGAESSRTGSIATAWKTSDSRPYALAAADSESLLLADEVDELWKEFVSELGDARVAEYISSARNQGIIKEETS